MEDQPQGPASQGSDARPKFFGTVNGVIAGITGLLVALAGLVTAYNQFAGKPAERAVAARPAGDTATETATVDVTATETEAEAESLPLRYKAVDATFEKTNGMWVYTGGDEVTRYQEVSREGGNTLVFDPMRKVYARWPTKGGMVKESDDDQKTWSDSFDVWVPEADAPAG